MLKRSTLVLWCVLLLTAVVPGSQGQITDLPNLSYGELKFPGSSVYLFNRYNGRNVVMTNSPTRVELMIASPDGAKTLLQADHVAAAAASGKWVFAQVQSGGTRTANLIDLDSLAARVIALPPPGLAQSAAISGDRLAVLLMPQGGPWASGAALVTYRCTDGAMEHSTSVNASFTTMLSFSSPERLLVIERDTARVTPVSITTGGMSLGPVIQLTGPWLDESRELASRQTHSRLNPRAVAREALLNAHGTSTRGTDLFFLAISKLAEGPRVIEVDGGGRQVAAYLLKAQLGPGGALPPSQNALCIAHDKLLYPDVKGIVREYRRP